VPSSDHEGLRRISVDLPIGLIDRFDELKDQWGLRRRGAVLERLLETLFDDNENPEEDKDLPFTSTSIVNLEENQLEIKDIQENSYIEDNAIILINSDKIEKVSSNSEETKVELNLSKNSDVSKLKNRQTKGIDLPGFIRKKTERLKTSLGKTRSPDKDYHSIIHSINPSVVHACIDEAISHWIALYGNKPKDEVIEAGMIWIAREIWPYLDDTDNLPFTWFAANKLMKRFCPSWEKKEPSFELIMVIAGVLEDPFATNTLRDRIPTLIRRFVNSFKRRHNVTSFQTLESTMTIHGALRLLDLPVTAGKSISLSTVRDAYKKLALSNHPDSGGSTEAMRKVNEAYQLLKDLYKKKDKQYQ